MADTIDRQAAIKVMTSVLWHLPNEWYRSLNEYEFSKGLAELGLNSVPSVQPYVPDTNVGDMISRQAAKQELYKMLHDCFWADDEEQDAVAVTLDNLPSVQPERKTGMWLPDNNNYYEERYICSACKRSYKVDTCMGKPIWNYCPCGAKMEEGEQEEEVLALAIKYGGRGKKKGNENDSGGTEAV